MLISSLDRMLTHLEYLNDYKKFKRVIDFIKSKFNQLLRQKEEYNNVEKSISINSHEVKQNNSLLEKLIGLQVKDLTYIVSTISRLLANISNTNVREILEDLWQRQTECVFATNEYFELIGKSELIEFCINSNVNNAFTDGKNVFSVVVSFLMLRIYLMQRFKIFKL